MYHSSDSVLWEVASKVITACLKKMGKAISNVATNNKNVNGQIKTHVWPLPSSLLAFIYHFFFWRDV
jgi:hypothetical protein